MSDSYHSCCEYLRLKEDLFSNCIFSESGVQIRDYFVIVSNRVSRNCTFCYTCF